MSSSHPFGDVIYSYTRKQAIDDGVLVDLSREPVIKTFWNHPFACTDSVWAVIEAGVSAGLDLDGILHDVCWLARCAVSQAQQTDLINFTVTIRNHDHELKLQCGPGDNLKPVLTLMFRHED